jgi:hypothetical protein
MTPQISQVTDKHIESELDRLTYSAPHTTGRAVIGLDLHMSHASIAEERCPIRWIA